MANNEMTKEEYKESRTISVKCLYDMYLLIELLEDNKRKFDDMVYEDDNTIWLSANGKDYWFSL